MRSDDAASDFGRQFERELFCPSVELQLGWCSDEPIGGRREGLKVHIVQALLTSYVFESGSESNGLMIGGSFYTHYFYI